MQDEQYLVPKRSYDRQYAHIYFARLAKSTPVMQKKAEAKWPLVPSGYRRRHAAPSRHACMHVGMCLPHALHVRCLACTSDGRAI